MARLGVSYEEVAMVASRIYAEGENPTVDKVREGLGGTGSKSTIAPFLKRWRSENQDKQMVLEQSLPSDLLQLVKSLYEHLQHQATVRIEEMSNEVAQARAQFEEKEQEGSQRRQVLEQSLEETRAQLVVENERADNLRDDNHHLQVTQAQMSAEIASMKGRLADYQQTTVDLHHQLEQTRKQFEHYQRASAEQRVQEKREAEQRIQRLDNDLVELRRNAAIQQKTLGQYEAQIQQFESENALLTRTLKATQEGHQASLANCQQLSEKSHAQMAVMEELRVLLQTTNSDYEKSRIEIMGLHKEKHQLKTDVLKFLEMLEQQRLENQRLAQENDLLKAEKGKNDMSKES